MSVYVFDTETTGIDEPQVIEAAWLQLVGFTYFSTGKSYFGRFKPSKPIALGAKATHHIIDADLADCPPHTDFQLPDDVEYLIGHNVDFDWKVAGEPQVKRICTLALSRMIWPHLDSHSQGALAYHLFGDVRARELLQDANSADADVYACQLILSHIIQALNVNSWEEVWQQSEKARIPTLMPYGKHKGVAIASIPSDYKQWLLRQADVDPYLVRALRGEVA